MSQDPILTIRCLVYNHEPFLRQCLDGFVMQQTNFPFEAIVHDDASTDGSAAIIREYAEKYPDIIKPIYETENQYSKHDGSIGRIMDAAIHPNSKYIAFCEGDDYWTDPHKLQLQVDFLERHPDYVICSHDVIYYHEDTHKFSELSVWGSSLSDGREGEEIVEYTLKSFFECYWTRPLSCVYRRGSYRDELSGKGYSIIKDYNFYYYVLKHGRGALMKRIMAVYREHSGGVWSRFSQSERLRQGAKDAFEIYRIEGDSRALSRTHEYTLKLLWELKREGKKNYVLPVLKDYYRNASLGAFLHLFGSYVYSSVIGWVLHRLRKARV